MITVTDIFAGAGGSSTGISAVEGVEVTIAANHWQLAIDVHQANHAETDHAHVDLHLEDPRNFPKTDILWASPECFTAGHLVTTRRGPISIEQVVVGDEVLTHRGRWRAVTNTMQRTAETILIEGGGTYAIETTAEHPFLAKRRPQVWNNEIRQYRRDDTQMSAWTKAGELGGARCGWGSRGSRLHPVPRSSPRPTAPSAAKGRGTAKNATQSRGDFIITCGHHEADELEHSLGAVAGLRWMRRALRATTTFTASNIELVRWCVQNFGQRAATKHLPAWALGMNTSST